MTNLMTASTQWATRPDDQRHETLDALQTAVSDRRELSHTKDLPLADLRLQHDGDNDLYLAGHNGAPVRFTNWSFSQLSNLLHTPAAYMRSLPAPLARLNMEYAMERTEHGRQDAKLLYTYGAGTGEARAFTGTGYGRIWDAEVVAAVQKINQDDRWHVPLGAYQGQISKRATTLYASDRDVFIFLVDEHRPIDIGEQTYFRGFYTWNSEVGKATFGLATFLYSYICANRIIWGARDVEELRIRHTALAPGRFVEQAAPALAAISDASDKPIRAAIEAAQNTRVGKTVADVEDWLASKGFGKLESKVAVEMAARGSDVGSSGDPTNLWDLVQGGTAAAREIGYTDERLSVERKWSSLLRERTEGALDRVGPTSGAVHIYTN